MFAQLWFGLGCCFLIFGSSSFGQTDAVFARANDEFAKGQFQEAIKDYDSLVKSGRSNAPLFYNLGNAYFRADDFGRAILSYERALALEPQHPEATANLPLARDEARALELQSDRIGRALNRVSANQMTVAATAALWIAVLAVGVMIVRDRRSAILRTLVGLALASAIVCAAIVYQIENSRKAIAIVTAPQVEARLATADNATSVMLLPAGSEINVLSRRGDWIYAFLPNNQRGWIPAASAEQVRL